MAANIKPHLDKLENNKDIEHWRVHMNDSNHILEIETKKMTREQVKNYIREAGIEAEFTSLPAGEDPRSNQ